MMIKLGPILKLNTVTANTWRVSGIVVTDLNETAPCITYLGKTINANVLVDLPATQSRVWQWFFDLPLKPYSQFILYKMNNEVYSLHLPASNSMPAIAYTSCNGVSDTKLLKKLDHKNALWQRLDALNNGQDTVNGQRFGPWNLLVMGGDQIYSDMMWSDVAELRTWLQLPSKQRFKRAFNQKMQQQVSRFFEQAYIDQWSQPEIQAALASIPTIMMWDDHDIFDGWGSYPTEQHFSPVYQGIFNLAKFYFALFQQHTLIDSDIVNTQALPLSMPTDNLANTQNQNTQNQKLGSVDSFNQGYVFGELGILVLDTRSERMPPIQSSPTEGFQSEQVISRNSWDAIFKWLDAQTGIKHLLLISSIPVVHPSLNALEKMFAFLPGQQSLEDDLADHWSTKAHQHERLRLIHRLFDFSKQTHCRVTVVSGDVHIAALGVVESTRDPTDINPQAINQLTSSGIVHPSPPASVLYFLEQVSKSVETVDRGITAQMLPFPATSSRFIGARNFLTIEPDAKNRLWANWWVENQMSPTTKIIHPLEQ